MILSSYTNQGGLVAAFLVVSASSDDAQARRLRYQDRATQRVALSLSLTNELIVVGMTADPKPQHAIRDADTQGAIRESDTDGPKSANLFEMQGGMAGVTL